MNNDRIALIAGDGILPKIIAERLENLGILSLLIVLQGERERFDFAHEKVFEVALGSVKKTLKLLSTNRINKAIMIGKIDKKGFLERKGFDLKALQMLRELKDGKDLTIFHIIQKEFSKIGIEILPQDEYISDMIADKGVLTKRKPTKAEMEDALFGMEHARKLASMDIGQTVVVKNQVIVAVEALEGTNETIRRGADISKKSVVWVARRLRVWVRIRSP